MASGRLNRRPSTRPTIHPGQERLTAPTTNPMAKRFMKAPRIAALLSGKLMGSMIPTSRAPKARPQTTPSITRDIVVLGELNTHQATHQCSAQTAQAASAYSRAATSSIDPNVVRDAGFHGKFELTDYRSRVGVPVLLCVSGPLWQVL